MPRDKQPISSVRFVPQILIFLLLSVIPMLVLLQSLHSVIKMYHPLANWNSALNKTSVLEAFGMLCGVGLTHVQR